MYIWRIVAVVALLAVSTALALAGSMMSIRMVNAINRRRPPEAQFEMRGCYGNKSFRLREEYKRLYPEGTLHNMRDVLTVGVLACWAVAAALLLR